jgi:thiosulfate/3-mercaptopyruvate sulfurtransferase
MAGVNGTYLIEPAELEARLEDDSLRVFDTAVTLEIGEKGYRAVSGREDYEREHIPGAGFMDLIEALSDTTTGLGFSLPAPAALAAACGALGISRETPVALYSSGHVMWATRAFWLLNYLGHDQVSVVDGGLRRWRAEGRPLQAGAREYPAGELTVALRPERFVQLEEMRQLVEAGSTCTVNALSPQVYAGEGAFHYGRRGHIPGSSNLHYEQLLQDGRFRDRDALERALAEQGLNSPARAVAYCGGGISATIPAFARLLVGLDDTAIYDGSMSEWVRSELPLKTGLQP